VLNTEISIKRSNSFWQAFGDQSVESYLKELTAMKARLKDIGWDYQRSLFGSEDLLKKLEASIDEEISYCNFYKEFTTRQLERNFDKWIFTRKEDIKSLYAEWRKPQGEQWTRTNGRIKATIQFDRSGAMVKITLECENDCQALKFLTEHKGFKPVHVKSEASINEKVRELTAAANRFMEEHQMPAYCSEKAEFEYLKKLLCIGGD
jgi:hypothetical protein